MRIVVSDRTCVFDLHKAALLEEFVGLPYAIVMPLPLFEGEVLPLDDDGKRRLMRRGLQVLNISDAGVSKAMRYANKYRALRVHDCFALAVAEDPEPSVLLTDDKHLRNVAHERGLSVRGVLWATAQIHEHECCSAGKLRDGLKVLRNDPRAFMPNESIRARTRRYR